jgi:transposase
MEGEIVLSMKEQRRHDVLARVAARDLTLKQASLALGLSCRQAKRVKRRYLSEGLKGLAHQNRGRAPSNTLPRTLREKVVRLFEERYQGTNDTHFTELLQSREGVTISRESVRRLLRGAGWPAKRRHMPPKHRRRRPRMEAMGMMAQWDGSPHRWFGMEKDPCCLMCAVDDAVGKILGALFIVEESSAGYLRLLDMILRRHGIPMSVYHDRHSTLVRTDDYWSLEEQLLGYQYPTHVGRVLQELGIRSIPAYSPQAKGRIERGFGVLQDRMLQEMRLDAITDMETANRWLEDVFIDRYNARFGLPASNTVAVFRKISAHERHQKIGFAYEATVGNDNCVRLGGLMIDIQAGVNRRSFARCKVLVRQHLDGTWSVWHEGLLIASHDATEFREPVRTWKRKHGNSNAKAKDALQVYMSSKPAPLPEGTFSRCT